MAEGQQSEERGALHVNTTLHYTEYTALHYSLIPRLKSCTKRHVLPTYVVVTRLRVLKEPNAVVLLYCSTVQVKGRVTVVLNTPECTAVL